MEYMEKSYYYLT